MAAGRRLDNCENGASGDGGRENANRTNLYLIDVPRLESHGVRGKHCILSVYMVLV